MRLCSLHCCATNNSGVCKGVGTIYSRAVWEVGGAEQCRPGRASLHASRCVEESRWRSLAISQGLGLSASWIITEQPDYLITPTVLFPCIPASSYFTSSHDGSTLGTILMELNAGKLSIQEKKMTQAMPANTDSLPFLSPARSLLQYPHISHAHSRFLNDEGTWGY